MTHVWERLWLGSRRDAEELAIANPHRITAVISLCEACVTGKRRDVRYVHVPIEDAEPVLGRQLDAIINAIAKNIRSGTALLHCDEGVSRAPSLTAAYLHVVGYRDVDAALAEIKRLRPMTNPSKTLFESVKEHLK
jgi:protein-tyrosine phosphatase